MTTTLYGHSSPPQPNEPNSDATCIVINSDNSNCNPIEPISVVPGVSLPMDSAAPSSSFPPVPFLHLSFNQDAICFAAGTDHGFRVYNCDSFLESCRREFDRQTGGGIAIVEMLFRSNMFALVGGGSDPKFPPNRVMLWDDCLGRCVGELSFRSLVRSVKLRRDRVVVVLEHKIFVYDFMNLKLLHPIETISNPKGLCAVSHRTPYMLLVCPGLQKGQVRLEHYASKRPKFIMAHESNLACFALTQDARWLATASTKGTLVRVFNTADGTLLQELRRGTDSADIYSLAFSSTAQWLAVSSDKCTVHVFNLKINQGFPVQSGCSTEPSSPFTPLSLLKGILPKYFSSQWSLAQFRLPEGCRCIVAFGHQMHTVITIGLDGSCYLCEFDPVKGGEMTQLDYHNFLKPGTPK